MELFDLLLEAYGDAEKFTKNAVKEDAVKSYLFFLKKNFIIFVLISIFIYYSIHLLIISVNKGSYGKN